MRYLFFDIECSDGIHICSFGYVITDEKFNLVSQRDIIINPQARFCLSARFDKPSIELAYSQETFKQSPLFPECYDTIKQLLEYPDQLIIGHSVDNDARFIRTACDRYDLPCINFKFNDSQIMFGEFANYKNNISLEDMGNELDIGKITYTHRSDVDSEITMKAVKQMCKQLQLSLSDLIELCPYCTGKMENFEITLDRPPKAELILTDDLIKENGNYVRGKNLRLFYKFLEVARPSEKATNLLNGNNYTLNMDYERSHFRESVVLIQAILDNGGKYVSKASSANYYINWSNSKGYCARFNYVKEEIRKGKRVKILELSEFLARLNLSEDDLKKLPLPSINLNDKPKWRSRHASEESYISNNSAPTLGDILFDKLKALKDDE